MAAAVGLAGRSGRLPRLLGPALRLHDGGCQPGGRVRGPAPPEESATASWTGWRQLHEAVGPRLPQQPGEPAAGGEGRVLYRGAWMVPFRTLVRLKVFQLSGVAAAAVPLATFLSQGGVSALSLGIAAALLLGCGVSASTLNYYSRRYVGQLALVPQAPPAPPLLRLSVLDFWGNREDNLRPVADLVPPFGGLEGEALKAVSRQPLIPVDVRGDRQYYISLKFGRAPESEKEALLALLRGTHACQRG